MSVYDQRGEQRVASCDQGGGAGSWSYKLSHAPPDRPDGRSEGKDTLSKMPRIH